MLKDADMRQVLVEKITQRNANLNYRIISEMAICDGRARVDIAVANGKLYGYEIKSDADTLERLATQRECYDKTFDRIIITVGEKYENIIEDYISPWWGIYVVKKTKNGALLIKTKREARNNPGIDVSSLLELLWRDEIEELLRQNGYTGLSKKNRRLLRKLVIERIPQKEIRDYCRETLKYREGWRD